MSQSLKMDHYCLAVFPPTLVKALQYVSKVGDTDAYFHIHSKIKI